MVYSKTYSQTTSFSSVNGKTHSSKNTYMIEQEGKQARFLKQVGVGEKHRSLAGYTPDGKKMAMLSQKINGGKVKYNKYVVENPRNLRAVIANSMNLTDLEKQLRSKTVKKPRSRGKSTRSKGKSTRSKGKSTRSKGKSTRSRGKSTRSRGKSTRSRGKSGRKAKKTRVAKRTRSIRKPKMLQRKSK